MLNCRGFVREYCEYQWPGDTQGYRDMVKGWETRRVRILRHDHESPAAQAGPAARMKDCTPVPFHPRFVSTDSADRVPRREL